jgi:hypothetical protein
MTPTPLYRPYSISVDKRTHWSLRTISRALIGDGTPRAELTPDGIAATLLAEAIEAKWPGLADGFNKRSQIDAEYVGKVKLAAEQKGDK